MIPNGERWNYLAVKKLLALLKGMENKQQETNLNLIKKYVIMKIFVTL